MFHRLLCVISLLGLVTQGCKGPSQTTIQESARAQMPSSADWLKKQYNHVVRIDSKDVAESDGSFLIDVPLQENPDSSSIFFLAAHIPVDRFFTGQGFYPGIKTFILVVPDWKFYQKVAEDATRMGIMLEPATTNLYYRVQRSDDSVSVDSVRISGNGHPELKYTEPEKPVNTLIVYRSESYGSVCCPRDPMREIAGNDSVFIKDFGHRHQLSIKQTYKQFNGKEGEYTVYYTLPALTTEQRLRFILEKRAQWVLPGVIKEEKYKPQVFTPQLVPVVDAGFNKMILAE